MLRAYYTVTKPGIIFGNVITALGGFALAAKGHIDYGLLLATIAGLSLIMAAAGVFNNYFDRYSDGKMERTKRRALVQKRISERNALLFATALAALGTFLLSFYTNVLTTAIALAGLFIYVVLYVFCKYRTVHAILVGGLAGAVPPLVGYCAVSNHIDGAALLLFVLLFLWQMPHFLAIALYRINEYRAASIPVLPIKKGVFLTQIHMLLYILAFIAAALAFTLFNYTGYLFFSMALALGLIWLGLCLRGFLSDNVRLWARQMFVLSLLVITLLSLMLPIDVIS